MDQVHVIRHKLLVEGLSQRRVAQEMGVSRNTVRKYTQVSEPAFKKPSQRARPVLEKVRPRLEELQEEWSKRTTTKQRITGSRLHQQLVQEGAYSISRRSTASFVCSAGWRRVDMKNSKSLLAAALFALLAACSGSPKTEGTSAPPTGAEAAPTPTAVADVPPAPVADAAWNAFFPQFQAAVATGDAAKVAALVAFSDGLTEEEFKNGFVDFFTDDLKKVIAETSATDWKMQDGGSEEYVVDWSQMGEEDGTPTGNSLILFFKKIDGQIRMIRWFAGG